MFGSIRSRTPVPVLSIDSISSRPSRVGQLRRILEQLEQRLGDDAGYVALRIPNIINPAFAKWLAHRSGYLQYTMNSLPDFVYMPSYVANVEGGMSPLQQSHHL
jgi:hypothetical protein